MNPGIHFIPGPPDHSDLLLDLRNSGPPQTRPHLPRPDARSPQASPRQSPHPSHMLLFFFLLSPYAPHSFP
ncbi:hypothetical protein BOTBODRAFT_175106 [Botryobasidium botryosum FD-172 SS1]|uniref:Uncharacterized protein n=1 Tax=Botryobasidium botryosum (strain FD-172 SS1) TaxID=930990 RepID=A0A067MQ20_BOTB1|nr:hypothetical protein BOTBODRAFT_175106 [Botryobasidium botryosum FD-172 SS1]